MGSNVFDIMGAARRGGMRGLGGLGALVAHPEVGMLQAWIRAVLNRARAEGITGAAEPSGFSADNRYGSATHLGLKRAVRAMVLMGSCGGGYSGSMIDSYGPNGAGHCIKVFHTPDTGFGLTAGQLAVCQTAWSAWKAGASSAAPDPQDQPRAPDTTPEDDAPVGDNAAGKDTGMSTTSKVLIGVGIVGGLGLIAWLLFGDKKRR